MLDTALNIEAMKVDVVVMRHKSPGSPHFLARHLESIIINAGDGRHEHPTQALLDMMTLRDKYGSLKGLRVALVGDILHSRVAMSNIIGLKKWALKLSSVVRQRLFRAVLRKWESKLRTPSMKRFNAQML